MKNTIRLILLGLMTWAIPFFVSFFFVDRNGNMLIDYYLFKSIMIVTGGLSGAFALFLYFKKTNQNYLIQSVIVGIIWYVMNVVLDILILVPMSKMPLQEYFFKIGFSYLIIPITSILVGQTLKTKVKA